MVFLVNQLNQKKGNQSMSDSTNISKLYDDACKRFLCEKNILAWILKYSTEEFANLPIEDIAYKYIEGEPSIGTDDEPTSISPVIAGMSNEELSLENVATKYDIKFKAVNPINNGKSAIIINLDAQSNFYPGYSIVTRGICYSAFMIAAQYGIVFTGENYDDVNKVYSIWLCTNPPANRNNTITCYKTIEHNMIGNVHEERSKYDLQTVVMICTSDNTSSVDNPLLELLSLIFNKGLEAKEIENKLRTNYGIEITPDLKERMINMCNLSYGVDQRGYNRGVNQRNKEIATDMFKDQKPLEEIVRYSKLSEDDVRKIGIAGGFIKNKR